MDFDPTTAQPEENLTAAPQKAAGGSFDPSTAKMFDPTSAKPFVEPEQKKTGLVRSTADTALDLVDMVLGWPTAMVSEAAKYQALGMGAAARMAGDESQTPEAVQRSADAIKQRIDQAATPSLRNVLEHFGYSKDAPPSGVAQVMNKVIDVTNQGGDYLEKATGGVVRSADVGNLRDELLTFGPLLGTLPKTGRAAMAEELAGNKAAIRGSKITKALDAGLTPSEIADGVLQQAAKKGIDTSAVTKQHIQASIEDIAAYYGTSVDRRTGARGPASQLQELNKAAPFVEEAAKQPPKTMPTDRLWEVKYADRAAEPVPELDLQTMLESVRAKGITDPVTVTISTKDNLAFLSDGNHRVAAARQLGMPEVPIRIERTSRSFSDEVKAKAKSPDYLGLTKEQIDAAPETATFEKRARVAPEEIDFGDFQKEYRQEKAAAPLENVKAAEAITPVARVGLAPEMTGVHFSQAQREMLSGKFFGTGIAAEESYRLKLATDPRIKSRISFYIDEGHGITPEVGVGTYKHEVPLNNLYDGAKNPLRLPIDSFMYGDFAGPDFNRFESAVLDAGFDGYYIKAAHGKQGGAVLLGKAAEAVKVMPKNSDTIINVGLNTNDGVGITRTQVEAALRDMDILVVKGDVHTSNTEPTFAAKITRPLTPEEANRLSVLLKQEAIAQTTNGTGALYGPAAEKWGPFNPEYFLTPEGKRLNEGFLGQAFKQRGAIGNLYTRTLPEAMELATEREGEVGKRTSKGWQVSVPMNYDEAAKLPMEDQINLTKSAAEMYRSNYFKRQMGVVDKQLIANAGLVMGGAALGAALSPNEKTQGLLLGAAIGFGLANLPRATEAIRGNWKSAAKTAAIGSAYAGVGALADSQNPVEGILVGSAIFGLRFLPKTKVHPEDQLINARNGNIAAEKRLNRMVAQAMEQAVPDKIKREELAVLAENPKFEGRTPEEKAVVSAWRGMAQSYRDIAMNEGVKMGFIEGYVSHIIERDGLPQSEVQKVLGELFGSPQGGIGGKAKFTKERAYPTFESLEKALEGTSLKLKTKDIAEITRIYSETMTRTIENQRLINNLKEATLGDIEGQKANLLTTEQRVGYVKLANPQLLPFYVHPDIAPALKFVFDSRNHNDLTNGLITLNRATKRLNVVGSFFHAKSLLEAYALAGGDLFKTKSAVDSALKQFREGGLGDEIDKGMRAGLRVELPTEVSPQALSQVGQLADFYTSKMLGKKIGLGEKVGSKIETFQEKTFDKFTWDYLHTGLKTATYLRLMEDYRLGQKGKGIPEDVYRQGVASHINDTFGGLDWYRVVSEAKTEAGRKVLMGALKPGSRDLLGVAIFAPDWTLSTVRAMTKALPGGAKNPANAMLAKQYALRTAILYATAITGVNYALSGHFPWDNKDPTRIDLGDGTNLQVVKHSMEFAEWVRDPWKTFGNKMGFIPRTVEALQTGKQYPGGPPVESRLGYVAAQVAPFTARSFQGDIDPETSAARALLGMFGISVYGMTEKEKEMAREARKARKEAKQQFDPSTAR